MVAQIVIHYRCNCISGRYDNTNSIKGTGSQIGESHINDDTVDLYNKRMYDGSYIQEDWK